jgi:hypothetical protein
VRGLKPCTARQTAWHGSTHARVGRAVSLEGASPIPRFILNVTSSWRLDFSQPSSGRSWTKEIWYQRSGDPCLNIFRFTTQPRASIAFLTSRLNTFTLRGIGLRYSLEPRRASSKTCPELYDCTIVTVPRNKGGDTKRSPFQLGPSTILTPLSMRIDHFPPVEKQSASLLVMRGPSISISQRLEEAVSHANFPIAFGRRRYSHMPTPNAYRLLRSRSELCLRLPFRLNHPIQVRT